MQVARRSADQQQSRAGHKQKRHRWEQVALLIALIHTASDNKGGLKSNGKMAATTGMATKIAATSMASRATREPSSP